MEPRRPIVDIEELAADLRLATAYSVRAGLLREQATIEAIGNAEKSLAPGQSPDVHALTKAVNEIVNLIAPVTLADLRYGRDPFAEKNQKIAKWLQAVLTTLALGTLVIIGAMMESLRSEQEVLQLLQQVQEAKPQQKLTSLRRLVQYEKPLDKSVGAEAYYNRLNELYQLNSKMKGSYTRALMAANAPFVSIPWREWFDLPPPESGSKESAKSESTASAPATPASGAVSGPAQAAQGAKSNTPQVYSYTPDDKVKLAKDFSQRCDEEKNGSVRLPAEAYGYPPWLKVILGEALHDFCFSQRMFSKIDSGVAVSQSMLLEETYDSNAYGNGPVLRNRVSQRINWALPFLYGLLGSVIFVMRNVANTRTASMGPFMVLMRLGLGGIAGIVIGWFAGGSSLSMPAGATLSLPFALAFLTGYGIDVLFNILDKLNRTIGEVSTKKA